LTLPPVRVFLATLGLATTCIGHGLANATIIAREE